MKTNNDFIEIKKWQFWDIYPKIVGDDAFPITNTDGNGMLKDLIIVVI